MESCKDHGGTVWCWGGSLDPRRELQEFEVSLSGNVAAVTVAVNCTEDGDYNPAAVIVIGPGPNGNQSGLTVTLDDPLPDPDCCTFTFAGDVVDTYPYETLAGDVNFSGRVNATDKNLVKGQMFVGGALNENNFFYDVNASGRINSTDKNIVKGFMGHEAVVPCG
ncbi:MAG: hypothetical protein IID40_07275 [Planctomycetes bacterium]|nr:hypothetical protein [Planctomycetota bacterium]